MKNAVAEPPLLPSLLAEFVDVDLGDVRRHERLFSIVRSLEASPSSSFPQAVGGDAAQLKGLYRFLDNQASDPAALLAPHQAASYQRARPFGNVFVSHDTTDVTYSSSFSNDTRVGLEPIGRFSQGFHAHISLAVERGGSFAPFGVLGLLTWARPAKQESVSRTSRRPTVAEESQWAESGRWLEQIRVCEQGKGDDLSLIHLADRDVDSFENLAEMQAAGWRYIFRLQYNRSLRWPSGHPSAAAKSINEALEAAPVLGHRVVLISRRGSDQTEKEKKKHPPRAARKATLALRGVCVPIARPESVSKSRPPLLWVNIVEALEETPPAGEKAVRWLLGTSESIETGTDCESIAEGYTHRWIIEEFIKVIKTGCGLERRQLKELGRLECALALLCPTAWRLLHMRHLSRDTPDAPAETILSTTEIAVLRQAKPGLPSILTVKSAVLAIAAMGGHLKSSGEPGWQTLWKGYEKLEILHDGFLLGLQAARIRDHRPTSGTCG